ncbi:MAG: hypothetical protein AB7F64_06000 [Gammaproteobacteria bacterium]
MLNSMIMEYTVLGEIRPGVGVNVLRGTKCGAAFPEDSFTKLRSLETACQFDVAFVQYEYSERFYKKVDFSALLKLGGLFKSFSMEFSHHDTQTTASDKNVTSLDIYYYVQLPAEEYQFTGNRLDSGLLENEEGRKHFRQVYGDMYMSGMIKGGILVAHLEFISENETERREIATKLSSKLSTEKIDATVETEIKSIVESASKQTTINISYKQLASTKSAIPLGNNISELIKKINEYEVVAIRDPKILFYSLSAYNNVVLTTDDVIRSQLDIHKAIDFQGLCKKYWLKAKKQFELVSLVIENRQSYSLPPTVTEDTLLSWKDYFENKMAYYENLAKDSENNTEEFLGKELKLEELKYPGGYAIKSDDYVRSEREREILGLFWHEKEHLDKGKNLPGAVISVPVDGDEFVWTSLWEKRHRESRKFDAKFYNKGAVAS